jgi:hypothetical protein
MVFAALTSLLNSPNIVINMKIFAISDLHLGEKPMEVFGEQWLDHWQKISANWDARVDDNDIVLIGGDISWAMKLGDAVADLQEIGKRKGIKILIKGNHDYWWAAIGQVRGALPPKMYAIQNDAVKIGNYVFAGTRGWVVPDDNKKDPNNYFSTQDEQLQDIKLYEREKLRLENSLKEAKKLLTEGDTLIGLNHFPPFNVRFQNSHFTSLYTTYGASAVIYGHLHGGSARKKDVVDKDGVKYFLTACDQLDFKLLNLDIN